MSQPCANGTPPVLKPVAEPSAALGSLIDEAWARWCGRPGQCLDGANYIARTILAAGYAREPTAPNTAPPGVLDTNYGRSIYSLLAAAWFYGGWAPETAAERAMQAIMEAKGWWPIQGEGALHSMIGRELGDLQRVDPETAR